MKNEKQYEDERFELKDLKTALLIGAYTNSGEEKACREHLDELEELARAYGFETLDKIACPLRKIESGTYLGKGKIEEIALMEGDVVIFDDEISPNQQKNLENMLARPVIDRTELILEIFSKRAQTKEARLQIELATVRYQLPRLRRLWTHLSRQSQGGGSGAYLKGAGERQIEIDRRLVKTRIAHLTREIEEVRKHRQIQRHRRLKKGIPTFAIVGYTNAGKSTLLNALTGAHILVEDKLFATLDTTTRKYTLPNHQEILLVDTVGFVRKLPHTLVAAFRATLEEALYTDILLHLVDVSNPRVEEQAQATYEVLKELNADDRPIITVFNKVDLLDSRLILHKLRVTYPKSVALSSTTREGFDDLMQRMTDELSKLRKVVTLRVPQSKYALVSTLIEEGTVLSLDYEGNDVLLEVEIPTQRESQVQPYVVE